MPLDVAILLSIGRHPASGRSRRADLDARALELALRLGNSVRLHAIHAGDAEIGEGSGMLPYLLAREMKAALLPAIAEAALSGESITALQALPRGRRRRLSAGLPALLTIDRAAPAGRQSAFARARAGKLVVLDVPALAEPKSSVRKVPARPKPTRLKVATGGSAAERLRAATEMQAGRGQLLLNPPAEEAARAIFDYLVKEGILSPATLVAPDASG